MESNRRTRLDPAIGSELTGWLHQATRVHAHLLTVVRLYGQPSRAGGGNEYARRAARGDRTLLASCLTHCICELEAIRRQVEAAIDATEAIVAFPGSKEKVAAMRERIEAGLALFSRGDTPPDMEARSC